MSDPKKYHDDAVQRYHAIREAYGLEAMVSCTLYDEKFGFIRGRRADSTTIKPLDNLFSYPPPEFCKSFGRANVPGFPVFYASDSVDVIADEVRLEDGDWIHVAVFFTPDPVTMEFLLLLHDGFSGDPEWAGLRDEIRNHISKHPDDFGRTPLVWDRIQNSALQFRLDNYQDTSAISHFWLYEKGVDAIVYPSIRNDNWCNFAVSPTFVDRHVKCYRVYACRWVGGQMEAHFTGTPDEDNKIAWSDFSSKDYDEWASGFESLVKVE